MNITTKANTTPSAFDLGADYPTRELVKHLSGFTGTVRLDAATEAKKPLLEDLSSRAAQSAQTMRGALEKEVEGLSGAGRLPVETLLFMHELRAAGFGVRVEGASAQYLTIAAQKGQTTDRIAVELDPGSQGYCVRGTRHEKTFDAIFTKMITGGAILDWQGELFGGGSMWKSFKGTGIRA